MGYRRRKRARKAPVARNKEEKCITKWCHNRRADKTTTKVLVSGRVAVYPSRLPYCWKCKSRRLKEKYPVTYVLNLLRSRARQRKLLFSITLAEFKQFCADTGYLKHRGTHPDDLTVDRIDWNKGYHIWNLRVLSHEENSAQGADNTPRAERVAIQEADEQSVSAYTLPSDDGEPF
jgi:hypothetical protein